MGYLVRLNDAEVFEVLWEGWQIAARPKTVTEIRTGGKVEEKLEAVSREIQAVVANQVSRRVLIEMPTAIFLEDVQFSFLKDVLAQLQPPQIRIKTMNRLWDIIEDTEKNWAGDQVSLLAKGFPGEASAK